MVTFLSLQQGQRGSTTGRSSSPVVGGATAGARESRVGRGVPTAHFLVHKHRARGGPAWNSSTWRLVIRADSGKGRGRRGSILGSWFPSDLSELLSTLMTSLFIFLRLFVRQV